jgi:hypothetical protein
LAKHVINRTKTSHEFKASYDLELDKLVQFLINYMHCNNQAYQNAKDDGTLSKLNLQSRTHCHFLKLLNNLSFLNESNCQDFSDLLLFVTS